MGRQEARQEQTMRDLVWWFLEDESGATAIEYAIIAGGIALVIVAVVNGIGSILKTTFTSVQTGFA
jgi:pilus assembly protein Flp/PilA